MGSYSKSVDGSNGGSASHQVGDNQVCEVCKGRKYTLVATRKLNQSSTVYERQVCQACATVDENEPVEPANMYPRSDKKTISGTGYLRNKKRRRKSSEE